MATIFAAIVVMLLIVGAMSIGVLMGRKPIAGSCGGVGAALSDPDYVCDLCGNDPNKCAEENDKSKQVAAKTEFYDAG
ncbi:(Na+)-NQR maturation NqrM [Zhongshania aquimaris]|uniref:(Na+)-NQR maturation NqrM n=1 Tax=Zhongshania aquimaris TaxID=2857107 RepID=A0ABS6VUE8_9GAMM|nr:(Na+)-NQR maturation NqrM [Zhongshania aquimaris]MBW2941957.1 (Na+)-NQR maturation NqrM [Zhongshania aquimaris]